MTGVRKDAVKALILERKCVNHLTVMQLADIALISRNTMTRYINNIHTDDWPLRTVKQLCVGLGINEDELKEAMKLYD